MTDSIKISWDTTSQQFEDINKLIVYYDTVKTSGDNWESSTALEKNSSQLSKGYLMISTKDNANFLPATMYYFRAKSFYDDLEDNIVIESMFSALDSGWYKLQTPEITYYSIGENSDTITIAWDKLADLPRGKDEQIEYVVSRGSTQEFAVLLDSNIFYDTINVEEGACFTYTVTARHSRFLSSAASAAVTGYAKLLPPTLARVEASTDSITVEWSYSPSYLKNIDCFYVYRKDDPSDFERELIDSVLVVEDEASYSWSDKDCTLGQDYYYYLRANKAGMIVSNPSDTGSAALKLLSPSLTQVSEGEYIDQIDLEWNGTKDALEYVILRSESWGFDTKDTLDTVQTTNYQDKDEELQDGTVYYYKVQSKRNHHLSDESTHRGGYTRLKKPVIDYVSENQPQVKLKWSRDGSAISDADAQIFIGEGNEVNNPKDSAYLRGLDSTIDLMALFPSSESWFIEGKIYYVKLRAVKTENDKNMSSGSAKSFDIISDFSTPKSFYSSISTPDFAITSGKLDTLFLSWNRMEDDVVNRVLVQWTKDGFGASVDTMSALFVNNGEDSTGFLLENNNDGEQNKLFPGLKYNFRIRFERGEIVSPWSKVEKGWLKLPAAQDLVASKGEHEDSITFTWSNYLESKDTTYDQTYKYVISYLDGTTFRSLPAIESREDFYNVTVPISSSDIPRGVMTTFQISGQTDSELGLPYQEVELSQDSGHTRLMEPVSSVNISDDLEKKIRLDWYLNLQDEDVLQIYKDLEVEYQIQRKVVGAEFTDEILASVDSLQQTSSAPIHL